MFVMWSWSGGGGDQSQRSKKERGGELSEL